jgi:hypothetical protein
VVADSKLSAAGIAQKRKSSQVPAGSPEAANPAGSGTTPAVPGVTGSETPSVPGSPSDKYGHGRGYSHESGMHPSPESSAPIDSSTILPEGKTKEELDNNYESVEQY